MEPEFTDYEKVIIAALGRKMSWWEINGNTLLVLSAAIALCVIGFTVDSRALEILGASLPALRLIKGMGGGAGADTIRSIVGKYQASLADTKFKRNSAAKVQIEAD
jgi:hypothetical protein